MNSSIEFPRYQADEPAEPAKRRRLLSPLNLAIAAGLIALMLNSAFGLLVWEDHWVDAAQTRWLRFTTLFRTDQIAVITNGQRFASHREIYPWSISFSSAGLSSAGKAVAYGGRLRFGLPDLQSAFPPLPPGHPALQLRAVETLRYRAKIHIGAKEWSAAAADYAQIVALEEPPSPQEHQLAQWKRGFYRSDNPFAFRADHEDLDRLIRLRLMAGDQAGYRKDCAELLRRVGHAVDPTTANNTAWVFALAPRATDDYTQVLKLSQFSVRLQYEYIFLNTLGVLLCRAGKYQEAIQTIEKGQALHQGTDPSDWLALAISHQHLGRRAQAQQFIARACREFEAASKQSQQPDAKQLWVAPLELELFSREARALRDSPDYR